MKKIIFITILFSTLISFGQNSNDKIIYKDSLFNEVDSTNYIHKYVIKNFSSESEKYEVEKYLKISSNDILEAIYQVSDKNNFILNGICKFFKNDKIIIISNYLDNRLNGYYAEYYENQKLKIEGEYKNSNEKDILLIKNYWNENGIQLTKDYEGIYEFLFNDKILIKGEIKNGLMEGIWKSTNIDFPKYEYNFSNSELIDGIIYQSEKSKRKIKKNEQALPKNGLETFYKKLSTEIHNKLKNSNVELGTYRFNIKFAIYEDGSINEITVLSKSNSNLDIESEVKKILKYQDKWNPEISNGIEVKSNKVLPIVIELRY